MHEQIIIDSKDKTSQLCLQRLRFLSQKHNAQINHLFQESNQPKLNLCYQSRYKSVFGLFRVWSFKQHARNSKSILTTSITHKISQPQLIFMYVLLTVIIIFTIVACNSLKNYSQSTPFHKLRILSQEDTQNQSLIYTQENLQNSTQEYDSNFNESDESQLSDNFNSSQYNNTYQLQDPVIEWPQQNQAYHIYTSIQPRLVIGVDHQRHLTLYDWNNQSSQIYYFHRVQSNYYYIINAQTQQYMTQSEELIENTTISRVRLSSKQRMLWRLVPARDNIKNSFYIVSKDDEAVDIHFRYWSIEKQTQIILSRFRRITSQVWILRKNTVLMNFQEKSNQMYEQKMSQLFQNAMLNFWNVNEQITLQQLKLEMQLRGISQPNWLYKPSQKQINSFDLPLQMTQTGFSKYLQYKPVKQSIEAFVTNNKKNNQEQDKDNSKQNQIANQSIKTPPNQFSPRYVTLQCAKNHTVAYVWFGQKKRPKEYNHILQKCRNNVVLLKQTEFETYSAQWNRVAPPQYQIIPENIPVRQRINILKLLYLYFESGIYADFDTQINEECFKDVYTNEMIFTNRMEDKNPLPFYFLPVYQIAAPEESFMMVRNKFNPQVKRMIEQKILEDKGQGDRWTECKYRQCLIVECQRHYRDNTYKKGYV